MTAGPVAEGERAEILDVLRGLALLGIFVAHVPGFSGWDYLPGPDQAALDFGSDAALQFLRDVFVRGKFYSLFSLLFGFGFAIQQASAGRRGIAFAARFRRRQFGLLTLGAMHSAFWHGDILLTYAVLGLLLIPFADTPPRHLLRWAVGLFALRGLWGVLMFLLAGSLESIGDSAVGDNAGKADVMGSVNAILAGYYNPDWTDMLVANARFLRLKWLLVLYEGKLVSIAGCFLLGVALGKWRVHERLAEFSPQLRRVTWVAGAVGVAGNLWLATLWSVAPTYPPTATGVFTNLLYAAAVPSLTIAIAAAFSLLWIHGIGRRLLGVFAPPGRMALTTYLSQTAIGIGIFYGVGFGLRGTISLTEALAVAFCVFALQAMIARCWLRVFRYGPFEWGWRCVTYGRLLPFRQRAHG
ncbi:MAG: DUF418 domain-containing protein [bacterium]|nr:DUF418 domain-containing protein [bacterium]